MAHSDDNIVIFTSDLPILQFLHTRTHFCVGGNISVRFGQDSTAKYLPAIEHFMPRINLENCCHKKCVCVAFNSSLLTI